MKKIIKLILMLLTVAMILPFAAACSRSSEIPDGYQDATCNGEYFRLFIPTQWNVNTESGISGGYVSGNFDGRVYYATVSMTEVAADSDIETSAAAEETSAALTYENLYWNKYSLKLGEQLKGYSVITENVVTTMGGRYASECTYLAEKTVSSGSETYTAVYKYRQLFSRRDGRMFVFTYSAVSGLFDSYDSEVDGIIDNIVYLTSPFAADKVREGVVDDDTPDGMIRVSDDKVAYRFYAPKNWIIDKNVGQSAVYFSETDKSNVSAVAYMPAIDTTTLAAYIEGCKKEYEASFSGYTLVSESAIGDLTVDERPAVRLVYTATVGFDSYKIDQTVISYGSMFYIITYTAKIENFDLHTADVNKMIEEFKFR